MRTLLLLPLALLGACPNGEGDPDATADNGGPETGAEVGGEVDADPLAGRSFYRITVDTEFGEHYELERDITETPDAYSFGQTHIFPAASLAVSEDLTFPATMNITFNFGIVLESADFPIQTDSAREYPFSTLPPEIDFFKGLRYRSTVPGATGSVTVTNWSITPGETMEGFFSGRLRQETDQPDKRWADVSGEFRFILPEMQQGQPQ